MRKPVTLDFETMPIEGNPIVNPPKPIGLAVEYPDNSTEYLTNWEEMKETWSNLINSKEELLFQNGWQFDIPVGSKWFECKDPSWERVHDTMYLLYLADPYALSLSLKPAAERYLGVGPDEQNELNEWILGNVPGANRKNCGAYIYLAPESLTRKYAIGDTRRTGGLFDLLYERQPREPYDRERRLAPILVGGTRRGIRVNRSGLHSDIEDYQESLKESTDRIYEILGREINLSSPKQMAECLDEQNLVTEWVLTDKGNRSVSKENLKGRVKDLELLELIEYRNTLSTCLGTFMIPWEAMSEQDGRVHPEWHQVRDTDNGKYFGTRTGRLSCSQPNLQNPPNVLGITNPKGLPPLPVLRRYFLPEEGCVWLKRDFSSQEIRVAAHFEEGELLQAYQANPALDPHKLTQELILERTGKDFERKQVKITGFQTLYGGGPKAISKQVGCSYEEGSELKRSYFSAMPGLRDLTRSVTARGRSGQSIRTWGGREYYAEKPKMVNGSKWDFSYKLLNYLIQGSAADQTKQCLIDWDDAKVEDEVFLATVHDEINICGHEKESAMKTLKTCMDKDYFDCPMQSEGFYGQNWADMEECE